MTILPPALAVAFAAFCVWLAVRIVNRRERWAKRTAIGLTIALIAYPLSTGPVLWLFAHRLLPKSSLPTINAIYSPMIYIVSCNDTADDIASWYYGLDGTLHAVKRPLPDGIRIIFHTNTAAGEQVIFDEVMKWPADSIRK